MAGRHHFLTKQGENMKKKTLSLSTILGFLGLILMIHAMNSQAATGAGITCSTAWRNSMSRARPWTGERSMHRILDGVYRCRHIGSKDAGTGSLRIDRIDGCRPHSRRTRDATSVRLTSTKLPGGRNPDPRGRPRRTRSAAG